MRWSEGTREAAACGLGTPERRTWGAGILLALLHLRLALPHPRTYTDMMPGPAHHVLCDVARALQPWACPQTRTTLPAMFLMNVTSTTWV